MNAKYKAGKCILVSLVLYCCTGLATESDVTKKFVISTTSGKGLFATLICVLDAIILKCENSKRIPAVYLNKNFPYYQKEGYNGSKNGWEYYFEPVSKLLVEATDIVNDKALGPRHPLTIELMKRSCLNSGNTDIRTKFYAYIKKYIKIKPAVLNKINDFYQQNMQGKKTIGIHLRGTDKKWETSPVPPQLIFDEANKHECDQFLVATDEQFLLEEAKRSLKRKVIYYDCFRSTNGEAIHTGNYHNKAKAGEDVLIEACLLSKCNKFIHTFSNVSVGVLCFNPRLENILFVPDYSIWKENIPFAR